MEENNTQATPGGCKQRLTELKTTILKVLDTLSEGVYPASPMGMTLLQLKEDVRNETNETLLFHKLKILAEVVNEEAKEPVTPWSLIGLGELEGGLKEGVIKTAESRMEET